MIAEAASESDRRAGFIAAALAYISWGFLPLYLKFIGFADVREILAQRILWSAPAALIAVFAMSGWKQGWGEIGAALNPRMLATLAASAAFLLVNWGLYVWLVLNDRVIESSLAYFLALLVSVAVGAIFFSERITPPQAAALGLATIGVVAQGMALGAAPWMALVICAAWSVYAIIRKRAAVPAATGLMLEMVMLSPAALALLFFASTSAPLAFTGSWTQAIPLALTGPITALPLMLFAFGARRLSFVAIGLMQFVAPSLQFATGLAYGEPFTPLRAVSFALIWLGLGLFSWDVVRRASAPQRS